MALAFTTLAQKHHFSSKWALKHLPSSNQAQNNLPLVFLHQAKEAKKNDAMRTRREFKAPEKLTETRPSISLSRSKSSRLSCQKKKKKGRKEGSITKKRIPQHQRERILPAVQHQSQPH